MGKGNTFVPNGGEWISSLLDIENYCLEEYKPTIHEPQQALLRSLRSIFMGQNISEISTKMVADCYEELKRLDTYKSEIQRYQSEYNGLLIGGEYHEGEFELCIPTSEIISTSLSDESGLSKEEKQQITEHHQSSIEETISQGNLGVFLRVNSSPNRDDYKELRINKTFIRRLQIAAGKQKIRDILSGEHIYSRSSEELINTVKADLSELGVTYKDIDRYINENTQT